VILRVVAGPLRQIHEDVVQDLPLGGVRVFRGLPRRQALDDGPDRVEILHILRRDLADERAEPRTVVTKPSASS